MNPQVVAARKTLEELPLFRLTAGWPVKAANPSSLRQSLTTFFRKEGKKKLACHSLRKGGALFWLMKGAQKQAVQIQGGWKTPDMLDRIYARTNRFMRKQALDQANAKPSAISQSTSWKSDSIPEGFVVSVLVSSVWASITAWKSSGNDPYSC